jgi:hypothetical protein
MAGSFSNDGESIALMAVLNNTFLALVTTEPNEGSTGLEVEGGGYARQPMQVTVSEGNPSIATNTDPIEFPAATTSWGEIGWAVVMDSVTGGVYRASVQFTDPNDPDTPLPQTIVSGNIVRIPAGTLQFSLE